MTSLVALSLSPAQHQERKDKIRKNAHRNDDKPETHNHDSELIGLVRSVLHNRGKLIATLIHIITAN